MSQFSLSWDSYKSNICNGFSTLQQNGEFVDMTIAADGHLVKVHQVLVALASPYLKDLIASAPCQHPVIFLNNISHKVLCYLLEYIYTGEVIVPSESLNAFSEAAKSLHIKGLENVNNDYSNNYGISVLPMENNEISTRNITGIKRKATQPLEGFEQVKLPLSARQVVVKSESAQDIRKPVSLNTSNNTDSFLDLDDTGPQDSDEEFKLDDTQQEMSASKHQATTSNLLFTVSIRGSLQLILNRYLYNLNSAKLKTGLRRWRCVDYRNLKCSAFVVTKGNVVVNRANPHNHAFHDQKILSKIQKKAVFSALDDVETYREKEKEIDNDARAQDDELDTFNTFTEKKD